MKIVSWNVNGIRAWHKKGKLQDLRELGADVFCVQETKAHRESVPPEVQSLGYLHSTWHSAIRKGYSSVATFSQARPDHIQVGMGNEKYDKEGRVLITQFGDVSIYNIYFPNGASREERHNYKQEFLADLYDHLAPKLEAGEKIVVLGDYNIAHREIDIHDPIKLSKTSGFLPEEREWFDEFLDLGFIDTFRYFNPDQTDTYTWWSYRELARTGNRGWRIDYICVSENLEESLKDAAVLDLMEGSDHCPVVLELSLD